MIGMRNPSNILRHELIGLECKVVKSANKDQEDIAGKILDETLKTLTIGGKTVQKKGSVFRVRLQGKNLDIEGDYIVARPEDRIKKKISKW